jgi:hypothetical protein
MKDPTPPPAGADKKEERKWKNHHAFVGGNQTETAGTRFPKAYRWCKRTTREKSLCRWGTLSEKEKK